MKDSLFHPSLTRQNNVRLCVCVWERKNERERTNERTNERERERRMEEEQQLRLGETAVSLQRLHCSPLPSPLLSPSPSPSPWMSPSHPFLILLSHRAAWPGATLSVHARTHKLQLRAHLTQTPSVRALCSSLRRQVRTGCVCYQTFIYWLKIGKTLPSLLPNPSRPPCYARPFLRDKGNYLQIILSKRKQNLI